MWAFAQPLRMTPAQKAQLETWIRASGTPRKIALRSRICLQAHKGKANRQIARQLGTSRPTVLLWRARFAATGPPGLEHEPPRSPSRQRLSEQRIKQIVNTTRQTPPPDAAHWTTRALGRHLGVGHATVARVWDRYGLQPHRARPFKSSRDQQSVEKLTDIVGLYVNPPDQALVWCVDDTAPNQALARRLPRRRLKSRASATMTPESVRHGTTRLLAALDGLHGAVIGGCFSRQRHEEFLLFLRRIDRETPHARQLHLMTDHSPTHQHPRVQPWLKRHPRWRLHFTPAKSSWHNSVGRWLGEITRRRLRRGTFRSATDLREAIHGCLRSKNQNPAPFVWTRRAAEIGATD
jgi:transposase